MTARNRKLFVLFFSAVIMAVPAMAQFTQFTNSSDASLFNLPEQTLSKKSILEASVLAQTTGGRHRAACSVCISPVTVEGTITVVVISLPDGTLVYRAGYSIFTPVPTGALILIYTISPTGAKQMIAAHQVSPAENGGGWAGWFWALIPQTEGKPLPADWKEGVGAFELDVTGSGTNFTESHDVRIGDPANKVGPLEVADVYPDGNIFIKGAFASLPLATIDGRNSPVSAGGWIVPPPGFTGDRTLAVCSTDFPRKCSSKPVNIPLN